jgi:hypothetical protein
MRFSVLLPERLAGWMRLRWLSSNCDSCITNRVQYKIDADKLSPEKRFYYERFKALLQVIKAIKINKFGKNNILLGPSAEEGECQVCIFHLFQQFLGCLKQRMTVKLR